MSNDVTTYLKYANLQLAAETWLDKIQKKFNENRKNSNREHA
jgi:hypothetical protein